ncbi:MAG TPA: glycosyltransferase family 4 protein [Burkholderiales bacterium]|nr:glycosyltransferase family 4 protein [Burkholderiales bacterium]
MRIAQVAPLIESVPPKGYGGTERVVSYLTEELVSQGHKVTLFASGDSITRAKLVSPVKRALRLDHRQDDATLYHTLLMDQVFDVASSFDVIHFHTDYLHLPLARRSTTPYVTTLHGRLDCPGLAPLYKHFRDTPLISISDSQRAPLRWASWRATVHHGLPSNLYSFYPGPGEYFAFVGRMSHEKRVDRAIEIAEHCGVPLYIAAKIDKTEEAYFNEYLKPLFKSPLVNYVGEIGEAEKNDFLGKAKALLFPIDWPEPFGLVQIESFACGTPVIAYRNGSVPEIMEDGVTGFVVTNQEEAFRAASNIELIDRRGCRDVFERRFTATRMATDYLGAYEGEIFDEDDLRIVGETNG